MRRSGDFIQKQGLFLLQHEKYAWFLIAVLAVIPFAASLSLAIMALVTLRNGGLAGLKCLVVFLAISICLSWMATGIAFLAPELLLTVLTCYLSALLLRVTISWQVVAGFVILLASSVIIAIHWFAPDYISEQYKALEQVFASLDQGKAIMNMLKSQPLESQDNFANYFLGLKAVTLVLTALLSLLMARTIQASIFNPGGFKKEMHAFRANGIGVILLVVSAYGAYQNHPVLLSCLPIFFVYLMTAGITLGLSILGKRKRLVTLTMLVLPILLVPHVMLPVYVLFGSIDSVFNLRSRLISITGDKQNKG